MYSELTGVEVAAVVKPALPKTKTILFTMYAGQVGETLASRVGVDVIIAKPDQFDSLFGVIGLLLGVAMNDSQHDQMILKDSDGVAKEGTALEGGPKPRQT